MGADADLHVFDYERYRTEVVPAFVAMVRTGEPPAWLAEIVRAGSADPDDFYSWADLVRRLRDRPVDLARYCSFLGDDLRYLGSRPVDRTTGAQLACQSSDYPARAWCLIHQDRDRSEVETLNTLHEAVVSVLCLGESQFVGRSVTPYYYRAVLERKGVPAGDPVRGLLDVLATRGAVIGYQFGGTEGIHGWLTPAETASLAAELDQLDLPRYEPSFAAMAAVRRAAGRESQTEWAELSLSFVRTVAVIAARDGKGVLWGNDVIPSLWAENYHVRDPRAVGHGG